KLVPAEQERQERGRREPRRQQRDQDPPERRDQPGAVDRGGFFGLDRDLADETREQPDRQRERERRVHEDQPGPRVAQLQRAHQQKERAHRGDLREGRARDDGQQQEALARERQSRDGIGGGDPSGERQDGGDRGDAEAVAERARHQALPE